jgi:hypothetical protein
VRYRAPLYDAAVWGCLIGVIIPILGLCAGSAALALTGAAVFALSYALTWIHAAYLLPSSVEFGDLRTFRDLAVALSCKAVDQ